MRRHPARWTLERRIPWLQLMVGLARRVSSGWRIAVQLSVDARRTPTYQHDRNAPRTPPYTADRAALRVQRAALASRVGHDASRGAGGGVLRDARLRRAARVSRLAEGDPVDRHH